MARGVTPYSYRPGNTPLHRVPGSLKLLCLLLFSVGGFLFGAPALAAATLLLIAGSLSAGIRPWELLRGIRPLLIMLIAIILFRSLGDTAVADSWFSLFDPAGFVEGLLFAWTILISFSAGALLFSVTTMRELRDSIGGIERAIIDLPVFILKHSKIPGSKKAIRRLEQYGEQSRLSLGISLMLGFLPRFFEIWETAETAYRARSGKKGIPQLLTLIPLVTERMIESAANTAEALEGRGLFFTS
jgi:biotin transport system permease protein